MIKIYGLTGGIGCGKSTVSAILSPFGFDIVDADLLTRNVHRDPGICQQIAHRFGPEVLDNAHEPGINRNVLGKIAFASPQNLADLQDIMQPALRLAAQKAIEQATHDVVLDAALLFEAHWQELVQKTIVVLAPLSVRISRIQRRNPQLSMQQIQSRIRSQMSDEMRISLSDAIIYNTGSRDDLRLQVLHIFDILPNP